MSESVAQRRILGLLRDVGFAAVEKAADGQKAINVARTAASHYSLIVVDAATAPVPFAEVVLAIRALPNQKLARFVVIAGFTIDRKPLLPIVNSGQCRFVSPAVQKPSMEEALRNLKLDVSRGG
jgi:hypothetical protein